MSDDAMWPSERRVSDAIGRLMEFWGFKRNMGRVWSVLYLSEMPLSARDLRERLEMSTGAVSMTVSELSRWGVVKRVWVAGDRREYFAAEGDLWKMISRVLSERERVEVVEAIAALEEALDYTSSRARETGRSEVKRAEFQKARIRELLELAKLGKTLLDALIGSARVDASPLMNILLGGRKRRS